MRGKEIVKEADRQRRMRQRRQRAKQRETDCASDEMLITRDSEAAETRVRQPVTGRDRGGENSAEGRGGGSAVCGHLATFQMTAQDLALEGAPASHGPGQDKPAWTASPGPRASDSKTL